VSAPHRVRPAVVLAASLVAALAAAAAGSAATPAGSPPLHGVLVPGVSLGGIRLGMTAPRVRSALGSGFGRCAGCAWETWYYNFRPFSPEGLGVEFQHGRVSAVFTLWSPPGWRTTAGLTTGDPEARVRAAFPGLGFRACDSYNELVRDAPGSATAFMIVGGKLWGFILAAPRALLCR
jgi:hypothetical protein